MKICQLNVSHDGYGRMTEAQIVRFIIPVTNVSVNEIIDKILISMLSKVIPRPLSVVLTEHSSYGFVKFINIIKHLVS